MAQGGCMCGNVRYTVEGEPVGTALCHCKDCQKISGSTYSTNAVYPGEAFKLTQGTPKTHVKTADTGRVVTSFFCGDCGSTMWRETVSFGNNKIVKIGTLDDAETLANAKPLMELFVPSRVPWVQPIPGAEQKDGM